MTVGGVLRRAGLRGAQFQWLSAGSVGLSIGLWLRAKTVDQDERGNAERRALFVGLWPSLLWVIGESVRREERGGRS
ncbi:hypothetical protein [Pseudonocardia parietis]|uniref:Uncharacterized protein n=1 Tax=Pseudonocardia parietis TaxID=570936 RepID=A0ABS4VZV3_9PSEU|nr:hypothetical protein [Pseudonocardia parietis]MBP2369439.1 hypothetical protein [Pseudonocardia parietis]